MGEVLSRRGIVGMLGLLAASPRAVAEQAKEALQEALSDDQRPPSPLGDAAGGPSQQPLSLEQLALKHMMADANRKARRRVNGINRCRSMSPAAKQAYTQAAYAEARPFGIQWEKVMGWRAQNDDTDW